MAKLIAAQIAKVTKENNATSLSGGLTLPEGEHTLKVAAKAAFGVLLVEAGDGKNWALPIVAGTVDKTKFELSDKAGASTLVIADAFITEMKAGGEYIITVSMNKKNRKVISNVVPVGDVSEDDADADNDLA